MIVIAVVSTLISSIALVGVALSLLLQARQLRTTQLQASRAAQLELIRIAADNRGLIFDVLGEADPESYLKGAFINWFFKYMELSYSMRALSEASVRTQATRLFAAGYPYNWWAKAREVYQIEAETKHERQFFNIVDEAFSHASKQRGPDSAVAEGSGSAPSATN
jgi:hypothetical protein